MRRVASGIVVLALVGCLGCSSKTVVRPVTPTTPTVAGIVYALPQTIVSPTVSLERTVDDPGIYVGYVPCFFPEADPLTDVTYQHGATLKVTGASISTRGIPDPKRVYVINTNAGWFTKTTFDAQVTEAGLLSTSDIEKTNQTAQFTVNALKTAATIAGSVLQATAPTYKVQLNVINATPDILQPFALCADRLQTEIKNRNKQLGTLSGDDKTTMQTAISDYQQALNDLQAILNMKDPAQQKAAADASTYARASAMYDRLLTLQQAREDALATLPQGAITTDAITTLSTKYDAAFQTYVGYFLGTESKDDWSPVFDVHPQEDSASNARSYCGTNATIPDAILFTYQDTEDETRATPVGVCIDPHHTADVQVPGKFRHAHCNAKGLQEVKLAMPCNLSSQLVQGTTPELTKSDYSYFYRLPANVTATVMDGTNALPPSFLQVAQWGIISALPASMGGSRHKYTVTLSPTTGALTNFAVDTDSRLGTLDVSPLEAGASAIATQVAARNNKLTNLQNQEQLLETQCKINAIKKINDPTLDCTSVLNSSSSSSSGTGR